MSRSSKASTKPATISQLPDRSALALAVWALALVAATSAGAQTLPLELSASSVRVSNVSEGGAVALFVGQRWRSGFASRLEVWTSVATDEDADGVVEFPIEEAPSTASVWVAIDASSGRFGSTSPAEGAPFLLEPGLGRSAEAGGGRLIPALDGVGAAHLLLIRRGVGIWVAQAVDGGLAENTGLADGRTLWIEPGWESLTGNDSSPGDYRPSDLLIAIDAAALSYDAGIFGGLNELP